MNVQASPAPSAPTAANRAPAEVTQKFTVTFTAPKDQYNDVAWKVGNAAMGAAILSPVTLGLSFVGPGERTLRNPLSLTGEFTSSFGGPKDAVEAAFAALTADLASPELAPHIKDVTVG